MFYSDEPGLKDYRDMDIRAIIREHLITKGTRTHNTQGKVIETNRYLRPQSIVTSGLFCYSLKDNPTNRRAVEYYCKRWAHQHQLWDDSNCTVFRVPADLWQECDEKNREFTKGKDREERQ